MLQNAISLRKSAPWPPNISDEHVFCIAPATRNASLQIRFKCPTHAIVFWKCYNTLMFCSLLRRCTIPCACHAKAHLNRTREFFALLTSKCALRHNGVHFFDIATSKSGPKLVCFVHFDFKCSSRHNGVHFIALFSTSQLLKMDRSWCVLYILTSKCASCHNGVQFSSLIWLDRSAPAALASLLFDPPEPQIIGQTVFRDFPTFRASASSFFWPFLFSDLLSSTLLWSSLFYSSLLSESSHLCFSSVHIVGSLTSKLPSIRFVVIIARWGRGQHLVWKNNGIIMANSDGIIVGYLGDGNDVT